MDIVGSLILFYCAPARTCITSLLDMAIDFNWFIKITRSFGSGFQSQNIARPKVRLIIIENKSEQRFLPDQIKEHFGLWTGDSFIDYCFFSYVNIMFIVHNVSGTIGLIFQGRRRYFFVIPIEIPMQREASTNVVCCHYGPCWPMDFFRFSILSIENSINPREISIASTLCWALFRLAVRSNLGKSSQPYFVLTRMIASGSSQFLCI
jgi:hypothetical protein